MDTTMTNHTLNQTITQAVKATIKQTAKPILYSHQVGGHKHTLLSSERVHHNINQSDNQSNIQTTKTILKLLPPAVKGSVERSFYETVNQSSDPKLSALINQPLNQADFQVLRAFTPKYYGTVELPNVDPSIPESAVGLDSQLDGQSINQASNQYVELEDLTSSFHKPCIIDLKIGTQTYDEDCSPLKQTLEHSKYPYQSVLGFRVTGWQRYKRHVSNQSINPSVINHYNDRSTESVDGFDECEYEFKDNKFGRSLDDQTIKPALKHFLSSSQCQCVIRSWICRLDRLIDWFEHQTSYRFYASSILFIYEGGWDQSIKQTNNETNQTPAKSHVCPPLPGGTTNQSINQSINQTINQPLHDPSSLCCAVCTQSVSHCRMSMIDFGHVFGDHREAWLGRCTQSTTSTEQSDKRRDEGYLHGLKTLRTILSAIEAENQSTDSSVNQSTNQIPRSSAG